MTESVTLTFVMAKRNRSSVDDGSDSSRFKDDDPSIHFLTEQMEMIAPFVDEVQALDWLRTTMSKLSGYAELGLFLKNPSNVTAVKWAALWLKDDDDLWMMEACMIMMDEPLPVVCTLLSNTNVPREVILQCVYNSVVQYNTHAGITDYLVRHAKPALEPPIYITIFHTACKRYDSMAWLRAVTPILDNPDSWRDDTYAEAVLTACDCGEDPMYVERTVTKALSRISDETLTSMRRRQCRPLEMGLTRVWRTTQDLALRDRLKRHMTYQ